MSSDEINTEELLAEYKQLQEIARWTQGILAVLLQEQGGVVEITGDTLASIDLNKVAITVKLDEERNIYIVEGTEVEV